MRKCPYCAEDILDAAIKCKHCHEFLIPNPPLSFGDCDTCNAPLTDSSDFCPACGVMQSTPQSEHRGETGNNLKCPERASNFGCSRDAGANGNQNNHTQDNVAGICTNCQEPVGVDEAFCGKCGMFFFVPYLKKPEKILHKKKI